MTFQSHVLLSGTSHFIVTNDVVLRQLCVTSHFIVPQKNYLFAS